LSAVRQLAPVAHDLVARDLTRPGPEIRPLPERLALFPQHQIRFLQNVVHPVLPGHQRDDVGVQRRLMPGDQPDKLRLFLNFVRHGAATISPKFGDVNEFPRRGTSDTSRDGRALAGAKSFDFPFHYMEK
jgi:hypothetical protein